MRIVWLTLAALAASAGGARADGTIPDLDGRGLLARWLAAQNRGDFAGYQALYARGFTGVRRSGERVVSLDRAGWMADRARMFRRPMVVAAGEVESLAARGGVTLTFTQEFSSGSYHDVGRKRLELVREEGAIRIAREELLASKIDDRLALLRALYPGYRTPDLRIATDDDARVAAFQWVVRSDGSVAGLVDLDGGGGREEEVALFDQLGAHPRVLGRDRSPSVAPEARYSLRSRELIIAGGEAAIEVVDEQEPRSNEQWGSRLTVWRRDGEQLVAVFSAEIDEDGPSCDCYPIRRREIATRRRGATWDLIEEITDNATGCHGRPRRRQVVHRWSGHDYP